jgi:hypothetical protein
MKHEHNANIADIADNANIGGSIVIAGNGRADTAIA